MEIDLSESSHPVGERAETVDHSSNVQGKLLLGNKVAKARVGQQLSPGLPKQGRDRVSEELRVHLCETMGYRHAADAHAGVRDFLNLYSHLDLQLRDNV
eukprot:99048-Prymnesium_polylepis.1